MCCGLGEEEGTKIRKKKRKKKEKKEKRKKRKNLIAAKSGLVGMKGYLKTYNQYLNCKILRGETLFQR